MTNYVVPTDAIVRSISAAKLPLKRFSPKEMLRVGRNQNGRVVIWTKEINCPNVQAGATGCQGRRVSPRSGIYLQLDTVVPALAGKFPELFRDISANDIGIALVNAYTPKPNITNRNGNGGGHFGGQETGWNGEDWYDENGFPKQIIRANQARQALVVLGLMDPHHVRFFNAINRIAAETEVYNDHELLQALQQLAADEGFGTSWSVFEKPQL